MDNNQDNNQDVKSSNPDRVTGAAIAPADTFKNSGRDIHQPKAPIVSVNPTSQDQSQVKGFKLSDKYKTIGKAVFVSPLTDADKQTNPWHGLDVGAGLFVPVAPGGTTDDLIADLQKKVFNFNMRNSIIETDINGDQIRDTHVVETRKRTEDGLIQLEGDGKPIVGATMQQPYNRVYFCRYAVKAVAKGDQVGQNDEAPADGALVVRVT